MQIDSAKTMRILSHQVRCQVRNRIHVVLNLVFFFRIHHNITHHLPNTLYFLAFFVVMIPLELFGKQSPDPHPYPHPYPYPYPSTSTTLSTCRSRQNVHVMLAIAERYDDQWE